MFVINQELDLEAAGMLCHCIQSGLGVFKRLGLQDTIRFLQDIAIIHLGSSRRTFIKS
jgi:hypothetical protein